MAGIAGLADGGATGVIPGKVNPKVADDITINAKKGEYILSTDDVALLGGPEAVDAMVKSLREQAGLPTKTGPKTHGQPDSKGRMDKPGLPSKGIAGLANAGLVDPYETDYQKLGNNPLAGFRQMAGIAGNALTNAGLTDQNIQRRVLDQSQPATSATPAPAQARPDMTADQMTAVARSKTPGLNMDTIPAHNPNAPIPISKVSPIATPKAAPKIDPGMVSIADSVNKVGLPETGTSLSKSTGGASVQLDGNKGLGDTTAISNRVDWSPGSANVRNLETNAKYNDEVKRAGIANAILQGPKTADQHLLAVQSGNTTWGMTPQQQQAIAGTNFAAQEKGIADTKDVESRRYVADAGLEGHKYAADSALKGQGIAGAAHVQAAEVGALGREAAARAELDRDAAKQQRADEKESRKNMETRIQDHLKSQGADFADPHNVAKAQQYYKDTTNWATKTAEVFNSSSLMKQYHPLYQKYAAADPKQRAEMEKDQSIQGMIQTVRMLGLKHGVDPFSRPAPPVYRIAPIKAAQLPISGMEGVQ